MRIVFLGSGEFGLPTLHRLHVECDVQAVVTAPAKMAGRNRKPRMTPIGAWALEHGIEVIETENINAPEIVAQINSLHADSMVVIAFGQKISHELITEHFAINLHGSILPKWRGASPINAAIMHGDSIAGVSVISLAERMDAGLVYGVASVEIGETETAGELHDRLALLGPDLVMEVLESDRNGVAQDETIVTIAPKLSRKDAIIDLSEDAETLAQKIRGLSPWPGCRLTIAGVDCKIIRVIANNNCGTIGEIMEDGAIGTGKGSLKILELQPSSGKPMQWKDFCNGRHVKCGDKCEVSK